MALVTKTRLRKVHAVSSVVAGVLMVIASVLAAFTLDPFTFIRSAWNVVFGMIILLLEIKENAPRYFPKKVDRWLMDAFGFTFSRVGRALFYIFVGTK